MSDPRADHSSTVLVHGGQTAFVTGVPARHPVRCLQGGPSWEQVADFYKHVYGCNSQAESVERTVAALREAPQAHACVLVCHSGPAGLGSQPQDICGVDFWLDEATQQPKGGDWGDVDLREALDRHAKGDRYDRPCSPVVCAGASTCTDSMLQAGLSPCTPARGVGICTQLDNVRVCRTPDLVVFGHMHEGLRYPAGRKRKMIAQDCKTGAILLNTAVVPRIKTVQNGADTDDSEHHHHFTVVEFEGTRLAKIESVWIAISRRTQQCRTESTQPLMRQASAGLELWDGFDETWAAAATAQRAEAVR